MAENEYTLDSFPSNKQVIPLEFVFYDEMGAKINLANYIGSRNEFVEAINIKSIRSYFNDKVRNSIYSVKDSE